MFDAAATCEKNKLNTSLQAGLDLFNSSIVIRLRFRNSETVLVADLEADLEARSFIKLRVLQADSDSFRFLWRFLC